MTDEKTNALALRGEKALAQNGTNALGLKPKFLIVGYGRMGKLVHKVLEEREENLVGIAEPDHEKVPEDIREKLWIPDVTRLADGDSEDTAPDNPGIVYEADTAICFTDPDTGYETTKYLVSRGIDTVVGTTKWYLNEDKSVNREMIAELDELADKNDCRFLYASNFSIGMNAFWQNLMQLAPMLAKAGYDVAVVEEHHTGKADISGTAMTIGQILLDAYDSKKRLKTKDFDQKIEPDEISIAVVRAGSTPGTHKVVFDSDVDRIELVHYVRDREIFAKGAVDAAYWLKEQLPGAYAITDRLK